MDGLLKSGRSTKIKCNQFISSQHTKDSHYFNKTHLGTSIRIERYLYKYIK